MTKENIKHLQWVISTCCHSLPLRYSTSSSSHKWVRLIALYSSMSVRVCVSDWVSKRLHSGCAFTFSTARTTYCTSCLLDFMFMKGEAGLDILHLALSDISICIQLQFSIFHYFWYSVLTSGPMAAALSETRGQARVREHKCLFFIFSLLCLVSVIDSLKTKDYVVNSSLLNILAIYLLTC